MLHGAPGDSRIWQWMFPIFHETTPSRWRAPQFVDALAAFVAALGLERPHLVGHSFETMVALSLRPTSIVNDLFEVTLETWNARWDHILIGHSDPSTTPLRRTRPQSPAVADTKVWSRATGATPVRAVATPRMSR